MFVVLKCMQIEIKFSSTLETKCLQKPVTTDNSEKVSVSNDFTPQIFQDYKTLLTQSQTVAISYVW